MGFFMAFVCSEQESMEPIYSQGFLSNLNPHQENGIFFCFHC